MISNDKAVLLWLFISSSKAFFNRNASFDFLLYPPLVDVGVVYLKLLNCFCKLGVPPNILPNLLTLILLVLY